MKSQQSKEMPRVFRVIYMILGVLLMIAVPIKGALVIVHGEFEQGPSRNIRTGHTSRGFALHGIAARTLGAGFICIGLSAGYFMTFFVGAKGNPEWKASRLDKVMGGLLVIAILLLVVSRILPGGG